MTCLGKLASTLETFNKKFERFIVEVFREEYKFFIGMFVGGLIAAYTTCP